jgi:hypothetical protein
LNGQAGNFETGVTALDDVEEEEEERGGEISRIDSSKVKSRIGG